MHPTLSESATSLLRAGTGGESPEIRTDSFQTIPLSGIHVRDMIKYQCSPPRKRMDKFMVIIQHILRGQGP